MKMLKCLCIFLITLRFASSFRTNMFCYYPSWTRFYEGVGRFSVTDVNVQLCTHITYMFAALDEGSFKIKVRDHRADIENRGYADFVALKNYNKNLKTFITIGGWGDSNDGTEKYSKLVNSTANISTFVASALAFLREHGLDGLDFDWEYPRTPEDKNYFALLMTALKEVFRPHGYLLSATILASAYQFEEATDVASLNQSTDFLNVAAYNFHGEWENYADHHAPLKKRPFESTSSETKNVEYHIKHYILKGYPASKINLGIPLYGKSWILSSFVSTPPAPASEGGPPGPFTKQKGLLSYYEICNSTKKNGWQVFQDHTGSTGPYAISPSNPTVWVSYDDPEMAVRKAEYVRSLGLGGVSLWDISMDDFRNICGGGPNPMMMAIKTVLSDRPSTMLSTGTIIMIVMISFGICLCLGIIVSFVVYARILRKRLSYMGNLAQLLDGNLSEFNPNLSLDDQAELLPYDTKWELPIESLFLEQQIGSGHYGRIVKARAIGIPPSSASETEVAVKMVKSCVDVHEIKALVSELKILAHLGCNLNVVSLLGAVTKNIDKGNLMVVLEYCRNGNLKDFLVRNRGSFINDLLDDDSYLMPLSSFAGGKEKIDQGKFANNGSGTICGQKQSTAVKISELIMWSFQIASGMNYLAKKKVIHGDLAARNVLLADDNVVKIADFGLARKTYKDSNYLKKGTEALPVKWMAIESIKDRVFSSQSDVWSFGVTLWEIFSLGQEPYAGVRAIQLLDRLSNGHRLKNAEYVPNVISDLMADCWKSNPSDRPTIEFCEKSLADLLSPDVLDQFTKAYDQYNYIMMNKSTSLPAQRKEQEQPEEYLGLV